MNLTKSADNLSRVDIDGKWYKEQLYITLKRVDKDIGTTTFNIALDDIDLEHFIATLMDFQHERP